MAPDAVPRAVSFGNGAILFFMQSREPDPVARVLGHALVGGIVLLAFGRRFGGSAVLASVLTIVAHEALDAPVAQKLSDLGV